MKLRCDQLVFVVLMMTLCACWGLNNKDSKLNTPDLGFSKDNLQSWEDWLSKRSLGSYPWRIGELTGDKFQNWQDWMYKRRFGSSPDSDFSSFDKSKFQEWKDWVSKRSTGSGAPFPEFSDFDKSKFQQWNDWVSKREFNSKPTNFEPFIGSGGAFQNWADYAKRQNFMFPSSDLGISGSPYFQNWQDWAKRIGADRQGSHTLNSRIKKRQLGFSRDRFDSFRRYFTDGLQDWRSSFKGSKRDTKDVKA